MDIAPFYCFILPLHPSFNAAPLPHSYTTLPHVPALPRPWPRPRPPCPAPAPDPAPDPASPPDTRMPLSAQVCL